MKFSIEKYLEGVRELNVALRSGESIDKLLTKAIALDKMVGGGDHLASHVPDEWYKNLKRMTVENYQGWRLDRKEKRESYHQRFLHWLGLGHDKEEQIKTFREVIRLYKLGKKLSTEPETKVWFERRIKRLETRLARLL